eukprot:COSAG05_NODE_601_length_8421_cov_19.862413_5_plen_138_part_00
MSCARQRTITGSKPVTDLEEAKRELTRCQNQWLELKARVDGGVFLTTLEERQALQRMGDLRRGWQALAQVLGDVAPPAPAGMLPASVEQPKSSESGEGDAFSFIWAFVSPILFLVVIFAIVNSLPDSGTRERRYGSK